MLRAVDAKSFREDPGWRFEGRHPVGAGTVKTDGARDAILLEATAFLAAFSPESYGLYKERFSRWDLAGVTREDAVGFAARQSLTLYPRPAPGAEDVSMADLLLLKRPDTSLVDLAQPVYGETIEAALERVRRREDGDASRALALVDIAMRRDATPGQRARIAGEAIDEAEREPILYSRLWVYEGLLPYLWQHGDRALAIKAGQAMAGTVARFCKCQDQACGSLPERSECLTAHQRVAEDLYNFEIAPEDLGLGDVSLRARVLVLKLKDLGLP